MLLDISFVCTIDLLKSIFNFKIENFIYKQSIMSKCNCERLLAKLNELESRIEDMVIANNAIVSRIANSIELKIDILSNAENIVNSQKVVPSDKKAKAKSVFFKDEFKKDKNIYMNNLYDQSEIDELYQLEEIKKKKNEEHKTSKIAEILYKKITKDATKLATLNKFYEEYKEKIKKEDDEIVPDLEDDEEKEEE
jgi:hypothetical protein